MKRISVSLEITHFCNKNCHLCSHRISGSNYRFLTQEQYALIAGNLRDFLISEIELIGGEPLTHPYFNQLLVNLKKDFPAARLVLVTNGKKLLELPGEAREQFARIYISWYEGFNDSVIQQVVKEKNIFINRPTFIDPFVDPQLNVKAAIKAYKNCSMKVIRFIGDRVYGCCLAESIERSYNTGCVHIDMKQNFLHELKNVPTYRACIHCFYAPRILGDFKLRLRNHLINLKKNLLTVGIFSKFDLNITWGIWRALKNRKNWYKYHKK
jgi:hypothetical protein